MAATKPRLLLSFDVEATGDGVLTGSMVAIGIVGAIEDTKVSANANWVHVRKQWCLEEIIPRGELCWAEFWTKHLDVWNYIQKNKVHPTVAMRELSNWLKELSSTFSVYWVAMPAAYDWMWLKSYYEKYGPEDKFEIRFKAECINGYRNVAALFGLEVVNQFNEYITPKHLALTHYPVEDAERQAYMYLRSRQWFLERANISKT